MPISQGSKQWRVAGVLRFKTDDSRYTWLNDTFALTSGTFDYDAGTAHWTTFCSHVHFFASPQAAQEWVATREQQIVILTIEEAFELGQLALSDFLRYI
jgi:Alkylmercury lyase